MHLALKIQKDESILIRAGTSSVGMLAIQMAKLSGLLVIASTRNKAKEKALLHNGADHVLIDDGNLSSQIRKLIPEGLNNVLELVGTATLKDSLRCTSQGGSVCFTGMLSEQWSIKEFAPLDYIPAAVNLTVYDSGQIRMDEKHFQSFINDVQAGKIKLNISKVFTLDEIVEAHNTWKVMPAQVKLSYWFKKSLLN